MSLLQITDLEKSYRSPDGAEHPVLDIHSFGLAEGEVVALRGQSGSGKTTLLNIIAGILSADAGSVVVDGQDVTKLSESARDIMRARSVGYVFQTFNLLQGYTALENVLLGMTFGGAVDRGHAERLLGQLGLSDRLSYKPSQLSVGQQQRVALARALANRPKLVLADEPTGNLDPSRAQEAVGLLRELCAEQGAALLLVSHDQAVLDRFDDVQDLADINRAGVGEGS